VKRPPILEFYKTSDGWRWTLSARNGRIIGASSEAFETREGCDNNANLVLGPHTRTPSGSDGYGFQVHR
jgi:uncharacterized protein YegP (UPF0339 family)